MPSAVEHKTLYPVYFVGHAGVGLLFEEARSFDGVRDSLREIGKRNPGHQAPLEGYRDFQRTL